MRGRKFFDTTSAGKLHPPTHRKNDTSLRVLVNVLLATTLGKTHLTGCIGEIGYWFQKESNRYGNFTYSQIFNDEVEHQIPIPFQKVTSFLNKLPVSAVSNFL